MGAAVALAIAVLTLATACGGGGGSESGAAKRTISADAQNQAKRINLKLSDFPDGWRASAPDEDTAGQRKFRKCIGADLSKVTIVGDARSKDFAQGESAQANSRAEITESASQAEDGMKQVSRGLSKPATKDCVRDAIGQTQGFKVGEIDVGELKAEPSPNVDESKAWEIVIPIEITSGNAKGLSATAYADVVYLRKSNAIASVSTFDVLSPLDVALRTHLVRTVARRMAESMYTWRAGSLA